MGRFLKRTPPVSAAEAGAPMTINTYLERIVKYIPSEIIAGYIAVNGFLTSMPENLVEWSLGINLCLFAALTVWFVAKFAQPGDAKRTQIMVSLGAFFIWAYAVTGKSGIFGEDYWKIYFAPIASSAVIIFTIVSALIEPKQ